MGKFRVDVTAADGGDAEIAAAMERDINSDPKLLKRAEGVCRREIRRIMREEIDGFVGVGKGICYKEF